MWILARFERVHSLELEAMNRRSGIKGIYNEADPDMIIVSMLEFQGAVYIATQKGVYIVTQDNKIKRLELIEKQ